MLKENVWEDKIEIPYFLQYTNELDYDEAKKCHQRWGDEWQEKKEIEMEIFNGKKEANINEGETASTMS